MMKLTHKVEITIIGKESGLNDHEEYARVSINGDGGIDHMIEAFKTALVAAGFALETAKKLDELII